MARTQHKLSDTTAKSASLKPGRHSDGGGLYLNVSPAGSKSWVFMWTRDGRRREMGLGAYPLIALAKARKMAAEHREAVADDRDPIAERDRQEEPTFGECADRFLDGNETQWRNAKHRAQWRMTLDVYAKPIRARKVSEIITADVLAILQPLWRTRPETASRLRGRLERVLDYAKAHGWRSGENPALWRGHLKSILPPRQRLSRGHHAAMPYRDVPAFIQELRTREAMAARALEFLILTAARSGEAFGATWDEIDLANAIWTIPAARMKAGKEHRVPLSTRALAILAALHETRVSPYIFPGRTAGRPLSNMAFDMLMRRMKVDAFTAHGFRSAFRDWAGEETHVPRDVAEQALAHTVGDAVERAYRRGDALEKRRALMAAWADYCEADRAGTVVEFRRA